MKNLLFSLGLFCLSFSLLAQSPPPTHHHKSSALMLEVPSFETTNWNGPINIGINLPVHDSITIIDSLIVEDLDFGYAILGFDYNDTAAIEDDTLKPSLTFTFDTTHIPYSYQRVYMHQQYSYKGDTDVVSNSFVFYFTPWRTIEIWNELTRPKKSLQI